MGLTLRRNDEIPNQAILDLVNSIQPHIPWNQDYLSWAHRDLSYCPSELWGYTDQKDRLVALCIASKKPLAYPKGCYAFMVQDVMTLPEYRGKGLFGKLLSMCTEYIAVGGIFGYAFPNELSVGAFDHLGWNTSPMMAKWQIDSVDALDEKIVLPKAKSIILKDQQYFQWRYSRTEYSYLEFEGVGLFCKIWIEGSKEVVHFLDIVGDMLILSNELLDSVAAELRLSSPSFTFWGYGEVEWSRNLSAAGARRVFDGRRFCIGRIKGGIDVDSVVRALSQGDSDVY